MNKRKKTSPILILFRILFTCCLIYSVVFIFQNSLQIASVSSEKSEQVQQIVNAAAGSVGLGPFSLHIIRKMAHFTEFMLMGFWFMLCLRVYTRHFIRHMSWPLFFGLTTAVTDETIQLFVDGRGSSVKDVWIDFAGFSVGLFVALFILMFVRMCVILFTHRHDHDAYEEEESEESYENVQQNSYNRRNENQYQASEMTMHKPSQLNEDVNMQAMKSRTMEYEENYDTNLQY